MGKVNGRLFGTILHPLGGVGIVLAVSLSLIFGWNGNLLAQNYTINPGGNNSGTTMDILDPKVGVNVTVPSASPSNNIVNIFENITEAEIQGFVGGFKNGQDSINNTININASGNVTGQVFGGLANNTNNAINNRVIVNTTSSDTGVWMNGSDIGGNVIGGGVVSGLAENNTVTLLNGTIEGNLVGGLTTLNGTVRNNTAIVDGTDANVTDVFGAQSYDTGILLENKVIIYNGTINNNIYGAALANATGTVANNSVTIYNATVEGNIFGGFNDNLSTANSTNVIGNKVVIHGGDFSGNITGGRSGSGQSDGNSVEIDDTTHNVSTIAADTNVYGGYSSNGSARSNSVIIHELADIFQADTIAGGYSESDPTGNVSDNKVDVTFVNVSNIYGGYAKSGNLTNNNVTVKKSEISGDVAAGYANIKGDVEGGYLFLEDTKVTGDIVGGYSGNGSARRNEVIVSDSDDVGNIYGGYSDNGTVSFNKVSFLNNSVSTGNVTGGHSELGEVFNNTVNIMGKEVGGDVIGGYSEKGIAKFNEVYVWSGQVNGSVMGGTSLDGAVEGNYVFASDVKVIGDIYGGYATNGASSNNTVVVSNTTFANLSGGYSSGHASDNKVLAYNINGTNVYGGYSQNGNATNNYVVLSDSANLTGLYGGRAASGDSYTGNTLFVNEYSNENSNIGKVANFQYYQFYLPASVADGFAALKATDIDLGATPVVDSIDVDAGAQIGFGDTIVLMSATNEIVGAENIDTDARYVGSYGYLFHYGYELGVEDDGHQLVAKVISSPSVTSHSKIVTETSAARLAFVNQAQDYLADKGISLAKARSATENGLGVFTGVSGGKNRYDTGSHVDLTGYNALIGVSMSNFFDQNRLTVGLFGELGYGSYDSFVPIPGAETAEAEGDVSYVGGGVLSRYDIQSSAGTLYLEGSARFGNAKADFMDKKNRFANRRVSFKTSGKYFGAHAGVGYDLRVAEDLGVDVYLKYLWNRQSGGKESVFGQKFSLDDADSSRVKAGARVNYNYSDSIRPYVGGAYIQETSGEADASVYGVSLPNASLKGSSALAELGVTLLSSDSFPISLDAGVQGYFGIRRGLSGTLDIKYEF
ncbi:MAG: autotransporter outer membrane beta-barrel domain-containing protein [Deltaproteobacteria bacterium]|jgi:hypothetical protein|nr:autotransporter outer membrane beta-barrel domain-containing protein [Deltaproteobacteria bacterium]